jgi:hypothetical protein
MASDNYDLMVASKTAVSANTQAASGNPDVELAFQHACTAVRFLFKESDNNNDYYLKSMTLQGVNTSGTMTYNSTLAGVTTAPPQPACGQIPGKSHRLQRRSTPDPATDGISFLRRRASTTPNWSSPTRSEMLMVRRSSP